MERVAFACELARFVAWGKAIAAVLSYEVPQKLAESEAALAGLYEAVDRIADERRREPREDLLTALVHASDVGGDRLAPDELRANVASLVLGGQDSTRCQLGLALETFARHPEQWTRLASGPELAETATEEVMRASSVVPILWRMATEGFRVPRAPDRRRHPIVVHGGRGPP